MEELLVGFKFGRGKIGYSRFIGLEQLKEAKEETIRRWEASGFLEGLTGYVDNDFKKFFESQWKKY
jgi:hypothetical protein